MKCWRRARVIPNGRKKWIHHSYYSSCGRRVKRAGCGREGSRNICFETKHRSRGGRGRGSGRFEAKHRSRGGRFILAVESFELIDADSASPSASFSENLGAGLGATACENAVTASPSTSSRPCTPKSRRSNTWTRLTPPRAPGHERINKARW
jgi:hypothetical protein